MEISTVEEFNTHWWLHTEQHYNAVQEANASGDTADYWRRLWEWNVAVLKEQGVEVAEHVPHPNEVAARQAVKDGILTAAEAGIPEEE